MPVIGLPFFCLGGIATMPNRQFRKTAGRGTIAGIETERKPP
jgi:hypothetical protein